MSENDSVEDEPCSINHNIKEYQQMATGVNVIEMAPEALVRLREDRERDGHPFEDVTLSRISVDSGTTAAPKWEHHYYRFSQHAAAVGGHHKATIHPVPAVYDEHAERYYVQKT